MAAFISSVQPAALATRLAPRLPAAPTAPTASRRFLRPVATSTSSGGGGGGVGGGVDEGDFRRRPRLVLYSKPGCCLCDGLKEKLHAAFSISGAGDKAHRSLQSIDLLVRDITENPEWEKRYQYEIPVLAKLLSDGSEEILPRLSPRLSVELIHKKIATAFEQ